MVVVMRVKRHLDLWNAVIWNSGSWNGGTSFGAGVCCKVQASWQGWKMRWVAFNSSRVLGKSIAYKSSGHDYSRPFNFLV
jgi:hypothetical protein